MFRTIWSKTLRDYRTAILSWGIGVGLLMTAVFAAATPAVREAYATIWPRFRFFGDGYAIQTPEGYVTARVLQVTVPIMLSIWPILAAARLLRGEEERGMMDVLLAAAPGRTRIVLEKLLAVAMALLLIALFVALGTIAGEVGGQVQVHSGRALLAALNLSLLAFCFATIALFISQFTSSRGAAGWTSGLMILSFVLDGSGRITNGTWVRYLSLFYYYNLNRPLIPGFGDRPAGAAVLLGLSLLLTAASVVLFAARDCGRPAFVWQPNRSGGGEQMEHSLRRAEREIWLRAIMPRAVRAQAGVAGWWLLGIVLWCGWLVMLIPGIQAPIQKALTQSPSLAKLFSGADTGTNEGFLSVLVFGIVVALVVIFALSLALDWPADLENRRLELVLSTPTARARLVLERFGAIALLTLPAPVLAWLATSGGAQIAGLKLDQGHVLAASFSMLPPAWIVVSLSFALAGQLRYSAVVSILTVYIMLAFLADLLKGLLQLPDWVLVLSIFHQYGSPITAGMNWGASLAMTGVACALLGIGVAQFRYAGIE